MDHSKSVTVASNAGDPGGGTTPQIKYPIQYRSTIYLSKARFQMGVAGSGDQILFAGGIADSFDVNSMVHFYPVSTVDIINTTSLQKTTAQLSIARSHVAAVALGKKIYFAGGFIGGTVSNRVDIYDVSSKIWTTASLSAPRAKIAAAAIGHYVVFAGGFDYTTPEPYKYASSVIDIYNTLTNTWSVGSFVSRKEPTAAAAGSTIAIAGYNSNGTGTSARLFNAGSNSWATKTLGNHAADPGFPMSVAGAGQKIIFGYGGGGIAPSPIIEVLNLSDNSITQKIGAYPRVKTASGGLGNYIFIAGGQGPQAGSSSAIEVFNVVNNKWYNKSLNTGLYYPAGAGTANTLMFTENDGSLAGTGQHPVQVFTVTGEPPTTFP